MISNEKNILLKQGESSNIAVQLIRQHNKNIYVKIELYDKDLKKENGQYKDHTLASNNPYPRTLEGKLTGDSYNVDSTSKQRRTYSCTFVVTDRDVKNREMEIAPDSTIWIDKYIRVYYGIKNNRDGKMYWWLIGTFTFVSPSYTFSATERQLTINCSDLMADYDGTKGGTIYDYTQNQPILDNNTVGELEKDPRLRLNMSYNFNISAGTTMNDAIAATLKLANIPESRCRIETYYGEGGHNKKDANNSSPTLVPHKMQFNVGQTWCDVWTQLSELFSSWEFFFDVDGSFVWRRIPTGADEDVILTHRIIEPLLISEKKDSSFRGIYNATEVWGKNITLSQSDRYVNKSTYANNTYSINLEEVDQASVTKNRNLIESWWTNNDRLAIFIGNTNTASNFKVTISAHLAGKTDTLYTATLNVVDGVNKPVEANYLLPNKTYVFTYHKTYDEKTKKTTSYLVLQGLTQAYGYYVENNPDCPFSFKSLGYLIPQRINAEALGNDAQCQARAERLTYESCAMLDTISLEALVIPWLDVNKKISYISQFDSDREKLVKKSDKELPQYIIKSFSWQTMSGTMSLTAYRFRSNYNYVLNN